MRKVRIGAGAGYSGDRIDPAVELAAEGSIAYLVFECLAEEFLSNYHRYADVLFQCYQQSEPHRIITPRNFPFELYASGEYSKLLESQWESQ